MAQSAGSKDVPCTEIHLRPVALHASADEDANASFFEAIGAIEESHLIEWLAATLQQSKAHVGDILDFIAGSASGIEVAVCQTQPPSGARLVTDGPSPTKVIWNPDPVPRLRRLQLHCLDADDLATQNDEEESQQLYQKYVQPFLIQRLQERKKKRKRPAILVIKAGTLFNMHRGGEAGADSSKGGPQERSFAARTDTMDPAGTLGAIDSDTELFAVFEELRELAKIDVRPYQDTLPTSYEVDIFRDYLRPYFDVNRFMRFNANDHFGFQGVRFRVCATDPQAGGRVGSSTLVFSKGSLQPSLLDRLPPEMVEDLRRLPRGLQILLLTSLEREEMVQAVEAQSVEEALRKGSGLSVAQLEELAPPFKWTGRRSVKREMQAEQASSPATSSSAGPGRPRNSLRGGSASETEEEVCHSCMVCLADFEMGTECRRLRCGHAFHAKCVEEWLQRSPVCPVCKAEPLPGCRAKRHKEQDEDRGGGAARSDSGQAQATQGVPRMTSARTCPTIREADVATLVSMGLPSNEAKRALISAGGDIQLACQILFPD